MSLLRTKGLQIGQDGTATNNFTLYQPGVPDGTLRIGNGNSGSATERIRINSNGDVGIGTQVNAGDTLRYLDVQNSDSGNSAGAILRLITNNVANSGVTSVDIVKYRSGGFIIGNNEPNAAAYTAFNVAGSERMRIDSAGRVTMPYQPMASINSNVTYDLRSGGATQEIVWTSVRVNVGNHYSSSTGRFTAPVTGNYLVTVSFHGPSDSGQRGYIAKNGNFTKGWAGSADADWGNFGTQMILDLVAGDYVSIYIWTGNYVHGDPAWGGWSINLLG